MSFYSNVQKCQLCLARKTFLLFFLIVICFFSRAEEFKFHHYTTNEGLSHNEIRVIDQAQDGRLWLGTQNGLSAFLGNRFTIYKHDPSDITSICGDKIDVLFADNRGRIWMSSNLGTSILDPDTEKALHWKTKSYKSYIANLIEQDTHGNLWLFSSQGNYKLPKGDLSIREEVFINTSVSCFSEDRSGNYWVGSNGQLSVYTPSLHKKNTFNLPSIGRVLCVKHEPLGVNYVVGNYGIIKISGDKVELVADQKQLFFQGYSIHTCCIYKDDFIVMGSYGGGVSVLHLRSNSITHYMHDPSKSLGISSNDVYAVYATDDDLLAVGTQEGLDIYDPLRHRFHSIIHDPGNNNSISHHFVQSIIQDSKGDIWVGTRDKGLDHLSIYSNAPVKYTVSHYPPGEDDKSSLMGSYVMQIMEDTQNRLWIATNGGGLNLLDRKSKLFTHFNSSSDKNSLPSDNVTSLLEDKYGNIWVGTSGGLALMKEDTNGITFKVYKSDRYNPKSLNMNGIYKLFEDSRGRIWVGINGGGVNLMHGTDSEDIWFEHFIHNPSDTTSLSNDEVFVIFEDSKQQLWIGTSGAGFNRMIETERADGTNRIAFKAYTESRGLADNEVNSILQDAQGQLWIATNKGITWFDPQTEKMVNYDVYDGLLKGKFRKNAALLDQDGYMWFGGSAGINRFLPEEIKRGGRQPKVSIASIYLNDKCIFPNREGERRVDFSNDIINLTLKWPVDRFGVQLFSNSLSGAERLRYYYRVKGMDKQWRAINNKNSILFMSGLLPGDYIIEVSTKMLGCDSSISQSILNVNVVLPVWLYICGSVILSFILFLFLRYILFWRKRPIDSYKLPVVKGELSDKLSDLGQRLVYLMENEKNYLNAHLSAIDLAQMAQVSYTELSHVLKEEMQQNFADFVNHYRVEEVKKQLADPANKEKPVLTIAWTCGFNSKSAFNRVFKSLTNETPTNYRKRMIK